MSVQTFVADAIDGLVAEYHDATRVTFDGRVCWIASVCDENQNRRGPRILDTSDHKTPEEARAWCQKQVRRRTGKLIKHWREAP